MEGPFIFFFGSAGADELLVFGTIKYSTSVKDKIASLNTLRGNLSIEARGVIASLLRSKVYVGDVKPNLPNLARIISIESIIVISFSLRASNIKLNL